MFNIWCSSLFQIVFGIAGIFLFSVHTYGKPGSLEYQLSGYIHRNALYGNPSFSEDRVFLVVVRDDSWYIETQKLSGEGEVERRYVTSCSNGKDIFGTTTTSQTRVSNRQGQGIHFVKRPSTLASVEYSSNGFPTNAADVFAPLLYLMFCSKCGDSHGLAGTEQFHAPSPDRLKTEAEIRSGIFSGSIPASVTFFYTRNEKKCTNAVYVAAGSKSVGTLVLPEGFTFIQYGGAEFAQESSRIVATVTNALAKASLTNFVPKLPVGSLVLDKRVKGTNVFTYRTKSGEWPELKEISRVQKFEEGHAERKLWVKAGIVGFLVTSLLVLAFGLKFKWLRD